MSAKMFLAAPLAAVPLFLALSPVAYADASVPSVSGDVLLGVGAVIAAVILWFVIRAALSMSGSSGDDEDKAGVGILDGIDEDDDRKK
jgi:hypothetical protein